MTRERALARLCVTGSMLAVLTACQVTLNARVDVEHDGSGAVQAAVGFDDEALRQLGDPSRELRVDDLRQAGWDVAGPRKEDDRLTWVRASKRFRSPAEAGRVAAELSGPEGPFRDFRVQRSRSFFRTRTRFTGVVDLSRGLAGLSDPALQERLGGADLGLDPGGLQRRYGAELDQRVRVRVEAHLPGRVESWQPHIGESVTMEARADAWNVQPLLPALAALVFALAAVAVVVSRGRTG